MSINTTQLLHKLSCANDIKAFISEYENEFHTITPTEFINDIIIERNIAPADVMKNSGQGDYVYKVIRGERKPSRDILIAISIGMKLSVDETQLLLRISKWAILDARDKRDSIIIYSIKEKKTFNELNDLLYEMGQQTL